MRRLLLSWVIVIFFFISLDAFAYYNFLSPESNVAIERFKEKDRVKEIVLEKRYGLVWTVTLPPNSGVETKEVIEAVYNDENGEFEAIYIFTNITITNAEGWTILVWGDATEFYPYHVPRIKFVFDD